MSNIDSDTARTNTAAPLSATGRRARYITIVWLGSMFVMIGLLGVPVLSALMMASGVAFALLAVSGIVQWRARRAVDAARLEDIRKLRENA